MLEVEVLGVSDSPHHAVVLLRHEDTILPIMVGGAEAQAIQMGIMGEKIGRPLTHDLVFNLLAGLRGILTSITIYKLENDTFFAHLNVEQRSPEGQIQQVLRIDSRPSDGIAIAVRAKCPIYVDEEVMAKAGQDIDTLGLDVDDSDADDEPDY